MKRIVLNSVNTDNCPCKGCADRYAGCHSNCLKYIGWKQDHEAKLQNLREQKQLDKLLFDNQVSRNKKVHQEGGIKYGRYSDDSR